MTVPVPVSTMNTSCTFTGGKEARDSFAFRVYHFSSRAHFYAGHAVVDNGRYNGNVEFILFCDGRF